MNLAQEQKEVMSMALRGEASEIYSSLREGDDKMVFIEKIEKIMRAFNCEHKVEWLS